MKYAKYLTLALYILSLCCEMIFTSSGISGILTKLSVVLLVGLLALSYQAIQPPPPRVCGSSNGPPVTMPRIKLSDGRNLSYIEIGVPKEKAKHKIIYLHGLDSSKHRVFPISQVLTVILQESSFLSFVLFCLSVDKIY